MPYTRNAKKTLTAKQSRFVSEYVRLGDATAAYRNAYKHGRAPKVSDKVEAGRLKNSPHINAAIEEAGK